MSKKRNKEKCRIGVFLAKKMNESKLFLCGECPVGTQVRFLLNGEKLTVARHGDISLPDPSVSLCTGATGA